MSQDGGETRQKRGFWAKLEQMTPEERTEFYRKRNEKVEAARRAKQSLLHEWKSGHLEKLTDLEEDLRAFDSNPNYLPLQSTLWKIHEFLNAGFSILDIRDKLISSQRISESGWDKLKKILFEKALSRIEDLGIDLFTQQRTASEGLKKQILILEAQQRKNPGDIRISREIRETHRQLMEIQSKLMELFTEAGVVGDKQKKVGTHITIINKIPRPVLTQTEKDVTPKKGLAPIEIEVKKDGN